MRPGTSDSSSAQQNSNVDGTSLWLKYGARFLGSISAVGALVLGVIVCITLSPICLLAGILQMSTGVIVALIEAPCLCMFLDFAQVPSKYFDSKPPWHRGLLYVVLSILPISLCRVLSTFFGSGLIFITGVLYGLMALGKKAPASQMKMNASSSYNLLQNSKTRDVESGVTQPKIVAAEKSGPI